ncbi:sulfite exporter TauE/SafE family protein [Kineococcus rhizosphaerae]|uniref:Cytochrome C biogenesis DsbD-like protein n=1 Tax=Kineococcus rhizosphaerae TaxID=559628 RepID=A0A2T0R7Y2_9ACTN|nr:sulfite exporter TauE/SafE family protein [Kineococcus rhizosphaerae]PRY17244.1 cytochrome C biogenesis DsbD-like protein [Kineococcus rhizosphaerae]
MLSSITPLGERGRASRWSVTVAFHLLGSAAGGTLLGTLLGGLGSLLPVPAAAVALVVVLLAAVTVAAEAGRSPWFPSWHRQVDEDWLHRYRGWVYGLGYGAQLGVGVVTIVTSPVLYLAMALMTATGGPGPGAVVGFAFGLVRALPLLAARSVTTPDRLAAVHRRLERLAPVGRRVTGSWSVVVAVAALAGGVL